MTKRRNTFHALAFVTNLHNPNPVYHRVPDWHDGEGCAGGYVACNAIVVTGTGMVFGNNAGVALPHEVHASCGTVIYRRLLRAEPGERNPVPGLETVCPGKMVRQGTILPLGHAERIGRPCKRCWKEPA